MVSRGETEEMALMGEIEEMVSRERQKRWCKRGDRRDGVNGETEEMVSRGET